MASSDGWPCWVRGGMQASDAQTGTCENSRVNSDRAARAIGTGMNYYTDEGLPTLELALDSMNAEELRKLAALTGQKVPSRKGDIAALIVQHLAGERLHTV